MELVSGRASIQVWAVMFQRLWFSPLVCMAPDPSPALHSGCQSRGFLFCIKALPFFTVSCGYQMMYETITIIYLLFLWDNPHLSWGEGILPGTWPWRPRGKALYAVRDSSREDHSSFNEWLRSCRILKSPCRVGHQLFSSWEVLLPAQPFIREQFASRMDSRVSGSL